VVVDQLLDALCDAEEKFFSLEDGSKLATHLIQEQERFGLLWMRQKETLGYRIGITHEGETSEF
jgi:hypothetical protein